MKKYYIIAKYNKKIEYLDCFESLSEAFKALVQYKIAYSRNYTIDIVVK